MDFEKRPTQTLEQRISTERMQQLDDELEGFYTGGQFIIKADPEIFDLIIQKIKAEIAQRNIEFMELDFRDADEKDIEEMVVWSEAKRRELMIARHKEPTKLPKQRLLVISVPPNIHHTMGNEIVKLVRTIPGVLAVQPKSITHREYNNLSHEFLGNIGIEKEI